jgi:hypothetical protein
VGDSAADADRILVDRALSTLGIGTWSYDLDRDLFTCDALTASAFGLSAGERRAGVGIVQVAEAVHPEDRERYHARRRFSLRFGGSYTLEYRTLLPDGTEHRLMARGVYHPASAGVPAGARGVVIDLARTPQDPGSHMFDEASLDGAAGVSLIDRIAMHAIAISRAIKDSRTVEGGLLRPAADDLLAEVLRVLALSAPVGRH